MTTSVTAIAPSLGDTHQGTFVTITGSGFKSEVGPVTSVTIGGTAITNLKVISDVTLTGVAPALTSGTYDVVVNFYNGSHVTLTAGYEAYYWTEITSGSSVPRIYDATLGVTQSSGQVSALADQGTAGLNLSQSTSSKQPSVASSRFGQAKAALVFPSTQDRYLSHGTVDALTHGNTVMACAKYTSAYSSSIQLPGMIAVGDDTSTRYGQILGFDSGIPCFSNDPGNGSVKYNLGSALYDDGSPHVFTKTHDSSGNWIGYIDGVCVATGTSTYTSHVGWDVIGSGDTDIFGFIGELACAVVMDGIISGGTSTVGHSSTGEQAKAEKLARAKFVQQSSQFKVESTDVSWDEPQGGYSEGRDGLMCCYDTATSKYFMFGGWNTAIWTNQTTNELWTSTDGISWTKQQSHLENPSQSGSGARPRRRHGGQLIPHLCQDGTWRMVLLAADIQDGTYWTGQGFANGTQPDCWLLDGSTLTWTPQTLNANWGRGTSAVWGFIAFSLPHGGGSQGLSGTLYVCGGQTGGGHGTSVKHVWKSTDDGATWTQITDASWVARGFAFCSQTVTGVGSSDKVLLVGGGEYDGGSGGANEVVYDDVYSFDGSTWTKLADHFGGLPRLYHNVVYNATMGQYVLADGFNGGSGGVGNISDCWMSPDGVTWVQQTIAPWAVTHADSLVTSPTSSKVLRQGGITVANADQVKVHSIALIAM
jgi:hypothetical protein